MAAPRTAKKTEETPEVVEAPEVQLSYEQARDELLSVITRLESGGENLADSMELFKRGEYLANLCEQYLADARATVEAAKQD